MKQIVVFIHPQHGMAFTTPIDTVNWTLEEHGMAAAPAGVPFIIVDESEVPKTAEEYAAYAPDFSNPAGIGVGAEEMHRRRAQRG